MVKYIYSVHPKSRWSTYKWDVAVKDEMQTGTQQLSRGRKILSVHFWTPQPFRHLVGGMNETIGYLSASLKPRCRHFCAVIGCKHHALPQRTSPDRGQIGPEHDGSGKNRVRGSLKFAWIAQFAPKLWKLQINCAENNKGKGNLFFFKWNSRQINLGEDTAVWRNQRLAHQHGMP